VSEPVVEVMTENAEDTARIGLALGHWLRDGDVVLLHGDLGAGKTTLAKGIASAMRVDAVVSSPSFALVNEYEAGLLAPVSKVYHLDLYRLQGESDLEPIGYADLIEPVDAVTIIEWPERAGKALPERFLLVALQYAGLDRRKIDITPYPDEECWNGRIAELRVRLSAG
jgi:tRNA threonylcarbamoyladenosine biosynthesis protein TsaE